MDLNPHSSDKESSESDASPLPTRRELARELAMQEKVRAIVTEEEKALLAFFEAPGYKDEMTKKEAFDVLMNRVVAQCVERNEHMA